MLYTMIVKSLINCWDNFEQDARISNTCLQTKHNLAGSQNLIKMSSVMPFSYNTVELCVVTINEKPWARVREVCKVLEYNKNTTNIVKNHCS